MSTSSKTARGDRRDGAARRSGGSGREEGRSEQEHPPATSPWEWVAAVLGAVLVLGAIGYMAYHALSEVAQVPVVTIEPVTIEAAGDSHVVRFRATNQSSVTAAALRIEAELRRGSAVVERAETTLDYLPPFGTRHAGLFFDEDPAQYDLRISPKGYEEP